MIQFDNSSSEKSFETKPNYSITTDVGNLHVKICNSITTCLNVFANCRSCLVWGRTCNGTGNCWQYDSETLRYLLNFTAAFFVLLGTIADFGVWYYVKDLKIFDEDDKTEKPAKKIEKKSDDATTKY